MKEKVFSHERLIESMARGLRWAAILNFRPALADKCEWSKFDEGFGGQYGYLTQFAEQFPQYAAKCDWEKLASLG